MTLKRNNKPAHLDLTRAKALVRQSSVLVNRGTPAVALQAKLEFESDFSDFELEPISPEFSPVRYASTQMNEWFERKAEEIALERSMNVDKGRFGQDRPTKINVTRKKSKNKKKIKSFLCHKMSTDIDAISPIDTMPSHLSQSCDSGLKEKSASNSSSFLAKFTKPKVKVRAKAISLRETDNKNRYSKQPLVGKNSKEQVQNGPGKARGKQANPAIRSQTYHLAPQKNQTLKTPIITNIDKDDFIATGPQPYRIKMKDCVLMGARMKNDIKTDFSRTISIGEDSLFGKVKIQ